MKIEYDIDFEKVVNELQANFGWSSIDVLHDSYKDLLNDTIKAVKNCSIPAVSGMCEHPWASVIGDGEMKPAKCLKCGKYL